MTTGSINVRMYGQCANVSCEPCYEPLRLETGRVACLLQREATREEQRTNERREVRVRGMRFCEIRRARGNAWWS